MRNKAYKIKREIKGDMLKLTITRENLYRIIEDYLFDEYKVELMTFPYAPMIGIQKHEKGEFEYNQFEKKSPNHLKWTFKKGTDKEFTVELEKNLNFWLTKSPMSITFNSLDEKKTIYFYFGKDSIVEDQENFSKKFKEEMTRFYTEK